MAGEDPVSVALKKAAARAARVATLDAAGAQQVDPDVENGNEKDPGRTFCRSCGGRCSSFGVRVA